MPIERVRRLSAILYQLSGVALIGVPVAVFLGLAFDPPQRLDMVREFSGIQVAEVLPSSVPWAVMLVGLLPFGPGLFVLVHMRRLFRRYRAGETLSYGCAQAIRRIGAGVLAMFGLGLLTYTLQILVLTSANPVGQRALSVNFGSNDLALLLTGGLVLLIGWVMGEAVAAAEENRGFV